jgi:translation initiation factor eIF-2B subunit epsilon
VHGVTSDLLMKNIYCYIVKEGYAACVQDTKSYDSVGYAPNPSLLLVPRTDTNTGLVSVPAAKTSYRDGPSRWFQMTTIQGGTSMSTTGEEVYHQRQYPRPLKVNQSLPLQLHNQFWHIHRTCEVGNNTLIGSCTTISNDAQIIDSVIGQHCTGWQCRARLLHF